MNLFPKWYELLLWFIISIVVHNFFILHPSPKETTLAIIFSTIISWTICTALNYFLHILKGKLS